MFEKEKKIAKKGELLSSINKDIAEKRAIRDRQS